MPKVSVIIPTYNSAEFIRETIESVLLQDFQDFEIIVVDDASTDDTKQVVDSIQSGKIRYICLPVNHGGPSKARNVGIMNASGKYIAIFDSDDMMLPGRLSTAVSVLDSYPDVAMTFTDILKFDENTGGKTETLLRHYDRFNSLKRDRLDNNLFIIDNVQAFNCLFYENFITPSSVTVRKSVLDQVGFFDEELTNADDLDMWFRISQRYKLGFLDTVTVKYRVRGGSISGRGARLASNRIKVFRRRLEFDLNRELRAQANKHIAANYEAIGYSNRCENRMEEARRNYLSSLKVKFDWRIIFQYIITYLGNDIIGFLRRLKHKCTL